MLLMAEGGMRWVKFRRWGFHDLLVLWLVGFSHAPQGERVSDLVMATEIVVRLWNMLDEGSKTPGVLESTRDESNINLST